MSSSSGGGGVDSAYDFVGLPGSGSGSGSSSSIVNAAAAAASSTTTLVTQHHNQGMAGLLIMLAVLCFIFAYCCWGAPFCRSLCRRYCCCCCCCHRLLLTDHDTNAACTDSESGGFVSAGNNNGRATTAAAGVRRNRTNATADPAMLGAPTIILLPHGRMLVVDGTIFTQLQADRTGLDFVELGESVMRAQRNPTGGNGGGRQLQTTSQASIIEMDAETPSKDSMGSIGCFPPPTYESIYGKEETADMPPSYSDILLHRLANLPFEIEDYSRDSKAEENRSSENCPHIISNPFASHHHHQNSRRTSAAASASNERNYSSLPRNPVDAYFVEDELRPSRSRQRRRSASTLTTCAQDRTRRTSSCGDDDDDDDHSRTNDNTTQLSRSDNVVDGRFSGSWDGISRAPMTNDVASEEAAAAASEQHSSRAANPIHARSRRSTTASPADDDAVQVHRYPEARYISDDDDDEQSDEDEANNFKVLADIRESRV